MGFQTAVSTRPEIGLPGAEVNPGNATYAALGYVSDGTAAAGSFAYAVTLEGDGEAVGAAGISGDTLLGFVERNQTSLLGYQVEDSLVYPLGFGLNIATAGSFYFQVPSDITDTLSGGEYVVVTDGAVSFSTTDTGTGWQVVLPHGVTSATADDIVIVEKL